jgi:predicted DNA-binding transcriptional regulator YafY
MATNKHATIRYNTLDRCFSHPIKKFFIVDLIAACNEAIYEFTGIQEGVKRRQIFDDIAFMKSEQGWSIPLLHIRAGKRVYYRYADKSFSINNKGINSTEAKQLSESLTILSRFKGLPQFVWVDEIAVRLEETFKLKGRTDSVVGFEQNPYLKGLTYFSDLFHAIQVKQAIQVTYQGFHKNGPSDMVFHPWYLKQYNNRWFCLGFNNQYNSHTIMALDRIIQIDASEYPYIENVTLDFDEYFEDVVGVTVKQHTPVQKVLLRVSPKTWPYIMSKPLHGSQKVKKTTDIEVYIELEVQINHELMAQIFSYMDGIQVIEPHILREKCKAIVSHLYSTYF